MKFWPWSKSRALDPQTIAIATKLRSASRFLANLASFIEDTDMGQLASNWTVVNGEIATLKSTNAQQATQITTLQQQLATAQQQPTLDADDQAAEAGIATEAQIAQAATQQAPPPVTGPTLAQ